MPERMRISSPRVSGMTNVYYIYLHIHMFIIRNCNNLIYLINISDAEAVDNEQRKQRRSRHSRRMGSYTRLESERWSVDETPRHSRDRISIGSPRVKLRDVSKLLQDSRTINIRRVSVFYSITRKILCASCILFFFLLLIFCNVNTQWNLLVPFNSVLK